MRLCESKQVTVTAVEGCLQFKHCYLGNWLALIASNFCVGPIKDKNWNNNSINARPWQSSRSIIYFFFSRWIETEFLSDNLRFCLSWIIILENLILKGTTRKLLLTCFIVCKMSNPAYPDSVKWTRNPDSTKHLMSVLISISSNEQTNIFEVPN